MSHQAYLLPRPTRAMTGLSGMRPLVGNTRLMYDTFTRSTLNELWAKSGDNPLLGASLCNDPTHFQDAEGVYYVAGVNTAGQSKIDLYSFTDPGTPGSLTNLLTEGTSDWDDTDIADPVIRWDPVTEQWLLFYTGWDGVADNQKIGVATADSITGPYTKYASNPIFEVASNGVGEFCPFRDVDGTWVAMMTIAPSISSINLGAGQTRYATSSDGFTWSDGGAINLTPSSEEDHCFFRYRDTYHLTVNNASGDLFDHIARSPGGPYIYQGQNGCILDGAAYDSSATYAPSNPRRNPSTRLWEQFYQGSSGSGQQLCLASRSVLGAWVPSDSADSSTYFDVDSNRLRRKTTVAASAWQWCLWGEFFTGNYTVESVIRIVTEAHGGIVAGIVLGEDSDELIFVGLDPSANLVAIRRINTSTKSTTADLDSATITHTTGADYRFRARVTPTSVDVDFHDGSSWNNSAVSLGSQSLVASRVGVISFGQNNAANFDNFSVHKGHVYS